MKTKKEKVVATANERNRTWTLRVYNEKGELTNKYRTLPTSKEEFDTDKYNTSNDWLYFLRVSADYYKV